MPSLCTLLLCHCVFLRFFSAAYLSVRICSTALPLISLLYCSAALPRQALLRRTITTPRLPLPLLGFTHLFCSYPTPFDSDQSKSVSYRICASPLLLCTLFLKALPLPVFASRGHATPPRCHSFPVEAVPFLIAALISEPCCTAAIQIPAPPFHCKSLRPIQRVSAALLMRAIRRLATPQHIGSPQHSALPQLPVSPCICASPMHCCPSISVAIRSYAAALRIGSVLSAAAHLLFVTNHSCSVAHPSVGVTDLCNAPARLRVMPKRVQSGPRSSVTLQSLPGSRR